MALEINSMKIAGLIIFFSLFIIPTAANATTFRYINGVAEGDGRNTELEITVDGMMVKGKMKAFPVCKSNIRLTETRLTFTGVASGPWEADTTTINGTWKGGDYGCDGGLMQNYPQYGAIMISIRKSSNPDMPGKEIYLHRIAGTSNGYVFKPLNRTQKTTPAATGGVPGWANKPVGKGPYFLPNTGQEVLASGLGAPSPGFTIPNTFNTKALHPIVLSAGESKTAFIKKIFKVMTMENNQLVNSTITSFSYKIEAFFWKPESTLAVSQSSSTSLRVTGKKEGSGMVYIKAYVRATDTNGKVRAGYDAYNWLVLVGKNALAAYKGKKMPGSMPPQKKVSGDINKLILTGRLVRQGSEEAIGNARISLEPDMTQEYSISNADGSFTARFHQVASGRYEVMALRRSRILRLTPEENVKLDVWPIKKYMLTITRERAAKSPVDVGTFWMDRAGVIFFGGPGRNKVEEIKIDTPSPVKPPLVTHKPVKPKPKSQPSAPPATPTGNQQPAPAGNSGGFINVFEEKLKGSDGEKVIVD